MFLLSENCRLYSKNPDRENLKITIESKNYRARVYVCACMIEENSPPDTRPGPGPGPAHDRNTTTGKGRNTGKAGKQNL